MRQAVSCSQRRAAAANSVHCKPLQPQPFSIHSIHATIIHDSPLNLGIKDLCFGTAHPLLRRESDPYAATVEGPCGAGRRLRFRSVVLVWPEHGSGDGRRLCASDKCITRCIFQITDDNGNEDCLHLQTLPNRKTQQLISSWVRWMSSSA